MDRNDWFFISTDNHPVETWFLNWFHGGGPTAPNDMAVYTDDYAISITGRVGVA